MVPVTDNSTHHNHNNLTTTDLGVLQRHVRATNTLLRAMSHTTMPLTKNTDQPISLELFPEKMAGSKSYKVLVNPDAFTLANATPFRHELLEVISRYLPATTKVIDRIDEDYGKGKGPNTEVLMYSSNTKSNQHQPRHKGEQKGHKDADRQPKHFVPRDGNTMSTMVASLAQNVVENPATASLMTKLVAMVHDCRRAYGAKKYGEQVNVGDTNTFGSVHGDPRGAVSVIHRMDSTNAIHSCFLQGNGGKSCVVTVLW